MRENADRKKIEYGNFFCSVKFHLSYMLKKSLVEAFITFLKQCIAIFKKPVFDISILLIPRTNALKYYQIPLGIMLLVQKQKFW